MSVVEWLVTMLQSGAGSLASYLAAHVLLCLVPAFFIAGAMTALIPKEAITRYLGRDASPWVSYPMAAVGGFVLAVCSCTILPLFAGIYAQGAGLGPAITFLFVGPAINILAVSYTGVAIGLDIALARIILSVAFGIGIGLIMAFLYRRDDKAHTLATTSGAFAATARIKRASVIFLLLLLAGLIVGTLAVPLLRDTYIQFTLPLGDTARWQATLDRLVPHDAGQGLEGVSVQGVLLIGLLALIGLTAWLGLDHIDEGFNAWSWAALGLIALTLLVAALRFTPTAEGLVIGITGRFIGEVLVLGAVAWVAWKWLDEYEVREWLWESWRFVKQIFPLLIVGVFIAGMVRVLIPPTLIETIAGKNTLLANLAGVLFGVFMYFPTLVEVPIANMFLGLGMHRGPLLAYLMADPELSIQSILITAKVIGQKKTWVYVGLVTLFSTLAGLLYGAWVDGVSLQRIAAYLLAVAVVLGLGLWLIGRRERRVVQTGSISKIE
ncbi:MAG TPA: permease [Anaerolineae bacterium]|nr:permease [Anaerolineae bacterium]